MIIVQSQGEESSKMMFFRRCHFMWILIICKSVSGDDVWKAVNGEATFVPVTGSLAPSTTSIIWKHRDNNGVVVKVIEWDREDGSTDIPNANYKSHATLDKSTGNLNLKHLELKHNGLYTVEINSKEQRKQFTLTVMEPVSKPYIHTKECLEDVRECSLNCEAASSEGTVIWKYSDGGKVQERYHNKRKIKVTNSSNPEEYYSCTLKNAVSEETSDPVYLRQLFHDRCTSTKSVIAIISSLTALIVAVVAVIIFLKRRQLSDYLSARRRKKKISRVQSDRLIFSAFLTGRRL